MYSSSFHPQLALSFSHYLSLSLATFSLFSVLSFFPLFFFASLSLFTFLLTLDHPQSIPLFFYWLFSRPPPISSSTFVVSRFLSTLVLTPPSSLFPFPLLSRSKLRPTPFFFFYYDILLLSSLTFCLLSLSRLLFRFYSFQFL